MLLALAFCIVIVTLCTIYWYEAYSERWLFQHRTAGAALDSLFVDASGLGLLVLQYFADLLALVTGPTPPFGIKDQQAAEDVARAQAEELLGSAP